MPSHANNLTPEERTLLLKLARLAICEQASSGRQVKVDEASLPPALRAPKACFVTLTRHGELRGCIGNLQPREPLFRAVMNNACGAAFRDTRFEPVRPDEIPGLEIEISVLTEPVPLAGGTPEDRLRQLRPGVDGVVLRAEGRTATFLPQVWEKIPDAHRFMEALANKAMLPPSVWRDPDAAVLAYQVESFEEAQAGG